MFRRAAVAVLVLPLVIGCAGPNKLAQRSQEKLAGGDRWRAWELATKALDKDPGNARARAAAAAAASSISQDWMRQIRALADADSVAAAEQVLEFASFRASAVRYATVPVPAEWSRDEQTLRRTAARLDYQRGCAALDGHRPKKAYLLFADVERFVPGYRDADALADRAHVEGLTRVAFIPFRTGSRDAQLGRDVTTRWRDDLARELTPPAVTFTRILDVGAVEREMTVAQLGRIGREEAVRIGRQTEAERVVWGSLGNIDSDTRLHVFVDVIARKVVEKRADGSQVVRWTNVPIEVVSRERTVTVDVDYDVISTRGSTSLAHGHAERSIMARTVWTPFMPVGDLSDYALVSDIVRAADPDKAKEMDTRWKSVCGENTTLRQVLDARRSTRSSARYRREVLARFIAGAAFVFIEDLPPPDDLAYAALARGWEPLQADLVRLDSVDDVDLGVPLAGPDGR
jgi:hypothetical protein